MIIGFDASRANKIARSGVEWHSYHLLKQLYRLDQKNSYFLYTPNPLAADLKPWPNNFKEKILFWPFKHFWTQIRLSWEILFNRPDVLFIPAHIFPIILGKKNIIVWPDVGHRRWPEYYSKRQLAIIEYGLKRARHCADKIITVSEFSKQELIRFYQINPDNIAVVYLGYDESKFLRKSESEIIAVKNKNLLSKPYLLYLGRLTSRKNLINLVEAFIYLRQTENREIDLVLAGDNDYGSQSILHKINASPYQSSIRVLGYVLEEDLPALLSGAECLINPSLYEGFGLTVLEAMACGCPVVCSSSGALPEIAQSAALYFNPQNPRDICQKILSVLQNPESRDSLIQKGLARVQNFSWEKCAKQTLNIINNQNS